MKRTSQVARFDRPTTSSGEDQPFLALRIRMLGSAAIDLAWLAEGKTDACILLANKPWDTAAGVVIAAEAGAQVVDLDGSMHTTRSKATIAAVPDLIGEIISLIHRSQTPDPGSPLA